MKRLIPTLLRLLLPIALLLAQHGVWAHGFGHDLEKIAAHGQVQGHGSHACCLPFEASGDALCGAPAMVPSVQPAVAVEVASASSTALPLLTLYRSRAPPLFS